MMTMIVEGILSIEHLRRIHSWNITVTLIRRFTFWWCRSKLISRQFAYRLEKITCYWLFLLGRYSYALFRCKIPRILLSHQCVPTLIYFLQPRGAMVCVHGNKSQISPCLGSASYKTQLFWRTRRALELGSCAPTALNPGIYSWYFKGVQAHHGYTGKGAPRLNHKFDMHYFCFE